MKKRQNTKIIYENKHLSDKLEEDEIIYAITIADIQEIANNILGRDLTFDEMYRVRKGVEWGFFDWDVVVKAAIENLEMDEKTNNINITLSN